MATLTKYTYYITHVGIYDKSGQICILLQPKIQIQQSHQSAILILDGLRISNRMISKLQTTIIHFISTYGGKICFAGQTQTNSPIRMASEPTCIGKQTHFPPMTAPKLQIVSMANTFSGIFVGDVIGAIPTVEQDKPSENQTPPNQTGYPQQKNIKSSGHKVDISLINYLLSHGLGFRWNLP